MKKHYLSLSVIMMGMMLFLSACGSGGAGGNGGGGTPAPIERPIAKLRSFVGHTFGGGSHLTGPADISETTQAQTGYLIVNDGPAIAHDGTLYVGTTTGFKGLNASDLSEKWSIGDTSFAAPAITLHHYIISGSTNKVLMVDDRGSSESHVEATVDGTVTQVATDASGNVFVIAGTNLYAFTVSRNAESFSLVQSYGPIDLAATITREILIHGNKLILGTDNSVLVRNKATGEAINLKDSISTQQHFTLNSAGNSLLIGNNTELKKLSLDDDFSVTPIRDIAVET